MIQFWVFRTMPDIAPCVVSNKDPRQRNHRNNAKMRNNIGGNRSRGCGCQLSLSLNNQATTMQSKLMEEASSS